MSDRIISVLESFQESTGKNIQRLYRLVPNVCAFYTLGWMGLERLVEVKKLLFIRSILALDDDVGTKVAFPEWSNYFFDNPEYCRENSFRSPVYDLLLAVYEFGLGGADREVIESGICISKAQWKEAVWKRAWELESMFQGIQALTHSNLNLLDNVCYMYIPRYL